MGGHYTAFIRNANNKWYHFNDTSVSEINESNIITNCKFKTYGCGSAIASSSQLVEMLKGKTIEEAKQIKDKEIATALELPPIKLHCSVLAEDSIAKAISMWEEKAAHRRHNLYPSNGM